MMKLNRYGWIVALLLVQAGLAQVGPAQASDWQLVPAASSLKFQATYDDAPVVGQFEAFDVGLDFSPQALSVDLTVTIDVTSVDTRNAERDDALAGSDWFAFKNHPQAVYSAAQVSLETDGRFRAEGTLRLKGIEKPVPIQFTWEEKATEATLVGSARMIGDTQINRLDFNVGEGDWADPVIGHEVMIEFELTLRKSPAAQ